MTTAQGIDLKNLIKNRREGYTLEQPFYVAPDIFDADFEAIVRQQWLLVGHASQIAEAGKYRVVEIAKESIILIRTKEGSISAFYNVCRHRGSRICLEAKGKTRFLTCPYHAWTYDLEGRLVSAKHMPDDFDPKTIGLKKCPLREVEGLLFINLGDGDDTEFKQVVKSVSSYLAPHQLTDCKVIYEKSYPTDANWKLALENFLECYHCKSSHPEYCSVNAHVKLSGHSTEKQTEEFMALMQAWEKKAQALGHPTGQVIPDIDGSGNFFGAYRHPINENYVSLTKDGTSAAPLLSGFTDFDGGETIVSFGPLAALSGANDYITLFSFIPVSATQTDMHLTWLVRADAEEGKDYDIEKITWMWDVTTEQDKKITNHNQAGVNSTAYIPGPYSVLEEDSAALMRWYLKQLTKWQVKETTA